jgi:hypothetical protein
LAASLTAALFLSMAYSSILLFALAVPAGLLAGTAGLDSGRLMNQVRPLRRNGRPYTGRALAPATNVATPSA